MTKTNTELKPYLTHGGAPEEGALLVFHFTAREARYYGWRCDIEADEYIYYRAQLLKYPKTFYPLANAAKLKAGIPHARNPPVCENCEVWGHGVDESGNCLSCEEFAGKVLAGLYDWVEKEYHND